MKTRVIQDRPEPDDGATPAEPPPPPPSGRTTSRLACAAGAPAPKIAIWGCLAFVVLALLIGKRPARISSPTSISSPARAMTPSRRSTTPA